MDIYQLKSFVTVAREKNLTRSSEILCMSQPALSTQIKILEDELGIVLFKRTSKGMDLTEQGLMLLDEAVGILEGVESFKNNALKIRNKPSGKIMIGINTNVETLKINELNSVVSKQFPEIEIHLIQSSSYEIKEAVKKQKIDIGFFFGENDDPEIANLKLSEMNLCIVVPVKWKKIAATKDLKNLEKYPWIMYTENCPFYKVLNGYLQSEGVKPNKMVFTNQDQVMYDLVYLEQGISFILEHDALKIKETGQIYIWPHKMFKIGLSLIYREEKMNNPSYSLIINFIKQLWSPEK
jgi:DNA-binding transcriptional LysR family regulator